MKSLSFRLMTLFLGVFLMAGCSTVGNADGKETDREPTEELAVGDALEIEFPDRPDTDTSGKLIRTNVKDDGTISLQLLEKPLKAAGLTPRDLELAIQKEYVPRFYRRLTVIVRPADRFYYVGGQVKQANRQLYLSGVTVTKAIQSAGDFTDFANRRKVKLIRTSGKIIIVDCIKASLHPKLDPKVFPGDRIEVPQSIY